MTTTPSPSIAPSPAGVTALLACPLCHGALEGIEALPHIDALPCRLCGASYPVRDGIPFLLPPATAHLPAHDELDHVRGAGHKHAQSVYYDREVAAEFEVQRPHGAPALYRWLLEEKFRRSIDRLPPLAGRTVVDVCCGSGMDAEFLERAGARVLALDISEGCVRRARERARRRGLAYVAVVGDVERLPLRDSAVDVAYVHDGLHHLADPLAGVREMARVSRHAVSITEPADAAITRLAVRLGLALAREEAGNRVARLRPRDVIAALAGAGFEAHARRYAMYYRHTPGAAMRVLSSPALLPAARVAVRAADAVIGPAGNKLVVTGRRAGNAKSAG
jgi:SAM-dependent methyltransferase/uncharacterized protein YbaR (Trm112 family)